MIKIFQSTDAPKDWATIEFILIHSYPPCLPLKIGVQDLAHFKQALYTFELHSQPPTWNSFLLDGVMDL